MTYNPYYTPQTWADGNASYPLSAARMTNLELAAQHAAYNASVGTVAFDDPYFAGGSDDATLTSILSYASAQTYPPVIKLANRLHNFSTQRVPYTGFRMLGPGGANDSELGNADQACEVHLSTSGAWLNVTGSDAWNCMVAGISFTGTSSTTFLGTDGTADWHGSLIRDCSFDGFLSVLGTVSQKLLMTTCLIDGWFQVQGCTNTGIHVGGSDSYLFMDGALIDSAASNAPGGTFHVHFEGMDNTTVGRMYITAEAGWGGILVDGCAYNAGGPPSNLGMLAFMPGQVIEGRSASAPCWGSLLRVQGGNVRMRDAYIARAMSNPSAMGHSPADAGAVMVTGGALLLDGCIYDRYTGQAESSPFVYVASSSNGPVQVRGTTYATKGGTWTGLPQVHNAGSGPFITDSLVDVV